MISTVPATLSLRWPDALISFMGDSPAQTTTSRISGMVLWKSQAISIAPETF